jgi:ATP-dependent Zn protease
MGGFVIQTELYTNGEDLPLFTVPDTPAPFQTPREMQRQHSETATAYHEAGHTVMHLLTDVLIDSVSIIPTDDDLGYTRWEHGAAAFFSLNRGNYRSRELQALAKAHALICMAGIVAEEIKFGSPYEDGAGHDLDSFHDVAYYMTRDTGGYATQKKHQAKRMLRQHWGKVEAIAAALLERKILTAEEVNQITGMKP